MSVSITIRHVPDSTRDVLAARAANSGRSLQEYLAAELQRLASQPSVEDWLARAKEFANERRPLPFNELLEAIEADRK